MWTNAKFNSKCGECSEEILEGDRIVYDTQTRKAYCKGCGVEMDGDDPADQESVTELSKKARNRRK